MRLALAQGRLALPGCLPNPPVGCVLVKEGEVIGRGFTQPPGFHHAEAMALAAMRLVSKRQQALERLPRDHTGVTAYVTLEPCSFHGRTPSCAQALVASGIRQVFVGMLDPDPRNSGAGVKILRHAGIDVVVGVLAEEADRDLAEYLIGKTACSGH
ncbi:bifunctional diaminohydroxyphosphoribosylaminopyrimidine deaminase/5-amino-6-(5-phosphoribosylamino)uracil reductase RibD [Phytopseudomonas flavescens]|nr:bifunctional diaminohydroxyphosphoribosylaminopyrimidine deaminase/5-amino-6-(5-phosphoribosylamino)uracil reductase RibD [Pseudomonas flavescens]